jgi:AcrR family transcriptional regulator
MARAIKNLESSQPELKLEIRHRPAHALKARGGVKALFPRAQASEKSAKIKTPPRRARAPEESAGVKTRMRLLAASRKLFAERGYCGVSLRDIVKEVGLNVAATNYHFGSKLELFKQVFADAAMPVSAQVIEKLQKAQQYEGSDLFLEAVIRAMIEPSFQDTDPALADFNRLRAHVFLESEEFAAALFHEFYARQAQFSMEMLKRAMPHLSERELAWRLHLMLGAMVFTSIPSGRFHPLVLGTYKPGDRAEAIRYLVRFLLAAFQAKPLA